MIVKCLICQNDFLKKTGNQITCSKECWKVQEKNKKKERMNDPEYKAKYLEKRKIEARKDYLKHTERCKQNAKKLRYTKICVYCGFEFKAYTKNMIFCWDECYRKRMSENRKWEQNPAFRNWVYVKNSDKKVSIHQFKEREFQKICKEMDSEMIQKHWYRFCENCLVNNSLRWEHHHIVFRSEKPRHEFLHDRRNIINLCIQCHNDFHKEKWKRNQIVIDRELNKIFWDDICAK